MPLASYPTHVNQSATVIIPIVPAEQSAVVIHVLANNTHPTSDVFLDVIKKSGSNTFYLCNRFKLEAANHTPVLLPLKPLLLMTGESLVARAYGIAQTDWDTVDWDTADWENLTYSISSSPIDIHSTISLTVA